MPIFSVIVPTFNRPHMLMRCIQSVLQQSFADFEVIIVNDASSIPYTDCMVQCHDDRIHYIHSPVHLGTARARNLALSKAGGKYISFIDDDDELSSHFLSKTFKHFDNTHPQIGVCFCNIQHIHYHDHHVTHTSLRDFETTLSTANLIDAFLSIGTSGTTFKMACLQIIGLFNENMKMVEDVEMFYRFIHHGFLPTYIPDIQVIVHEHNEYRMTDVALNRNRIIEAEWILEQYKDVFSQHPAIKQKFMYCILKLKRDFLRLKLPA